MDAISFFCLFVCLFGWLFILHKDTSDYLITNGICEQSATSYLKASRVMTYTLSKLVSKKASEAMLHCHVKKSHAAAAYVQKQ